MISAAVQRAFEDVAARERDVLQTFSTGAFPERSDVMRAEQSIPTVDPLAACAPPDAFFVTLDERGRHVFGSGGSFEIHDGTLRDQSGHAVLGYRDDRSALEPLRADAVDVALGLTAGTHIQSDGLVTYERMTVDPRSGKRQAQRVAIGRIALARFPAATKLQPADAQHAVAPAGIIPHLGRPGDGNFGTLQPFSRASSRIDIDAGLQRLQEAYLALDALRAAGKAQGSTAKTAMDLLK